jgi:hypothetical protein
MTRKHTHTYIKHKMGDSFFVTSKNETFGEKRIECELSILVFIKCFIEVSDVPIDIWRDKAAIYIK